MKPLNTASIHCRLLRWYEREKRDLPWRKNRDPYRVWLSEIMLQQTRVEAVIPYYQRFLSHFPTVKELAEADLDSINNLWAGLGYYSRARNLHSAAKQILQLHLGKFPRTKEELLELKGIGPYTAAAIASIAFDQPCCALDGNLERVFYRLLAFRGNPKSGEGRKALLAFGENLVALGKPGLVNQAVMDLSSAYCHPRSPNCTACPIASLCDSRKLGIQEQVPMKKSRKEKIFLDAKAWVVLHQGKILLAKRAPGQWLAGIWDIPWRIEEKDKEFVSPSFGEERATCSLERTITKHKISFSVQALACEKMPTKKEISSMQADAAEYRWVSLDELHGVNLPRPSEKALEILLNKLS